MRTDWEAWSKRDLAGEDIVRLILDGTVVRVRLDRKATTISLLVVLGVRRDGQKVLLAVKNMGGESEAAWRGVLDDLVARGLRTPDFLIIDGARRSGTGVGGAVARRAGAALHGAQASQPAGPCAGRAARRGHGRLHRHDLRRDGQGGGGSAAGRSCASGGCAARPWPTSLEEAGDRLFTFLRLPPSQWKSARTTNAIERLHEEFKRRIKTQTVLPSAETAAMLFWALLASGQITMRKVDGWQTLAEQASSRRSA